MAVFSKSGVVLYTTCDYRKAMPFKGLFRSSKDDTRSHRSFLKLRDEVVANIPPQLKPVPPKSKSNQVSNSSPITHEADYRTSKYFDSQDLIGSDSDDVDSNTRKPNSAKDGDLQRRSYGGSQRDQGNQGNQGNKGNHRENTMGNAGKDQGSQTANSKRNNGNHDDDKHVSSPTQDSDRTNFYKQGYSTQDSDSSIDERNHSSSRYHHSHYNTGDIVSHDSASFHSSHDTLHHSISAKPPQINVQSYDHSNSHNYDSDASFDNRNAYESDYSDHSNHRNETRNSFDSQDYNSKNSLASNPPSSQLSPRNDNFSHKKSGSIHVKSNPNTGSSTPVLKKDQSSLGLKRFLKRMVKDKSPLSHSKSSELFNHYGTVGKLLGTGASGSVNLITSKDDGNIYAVKKFRPKLPAESESDYKTKVRNEFKIGNMLHHENLIFTKELIKDYPHKSRLSSHDAEYYIVMEYCPYDFFNLVMSGLMEVNEIACYFKQIINGVAFLHQHGLAHRDLKLDNCVVNDWGQLKIIDFGSAVQFKRDLFVNGSSGLDLTQSNTSLDSRQSVTLARGIVGSDPYLAPEVFEPSNFGYDPRLVDIWSIAIIYCCMILRRFPWKIPKSSDPSFKSFSQPDDNIHDSLSDVSLSTQDSNSSRRNGRGPERLLRLLPIESRKLISSMLIIDPTRRYLVEDILDDQFYNEIDHCHNIGKDKYYTANNHKHHLVTEEELNKINEEKSKQKERDREKKNHRHDR